MGHEQLGDFIRRERRKMVNYVRNLVDSAAEMDAEDFVQEVLLSVMERTDPELPLEHLAAYIYRSLRNRVIDFFRVRKPNVTIEARVGEEGEELKAILRDLGPDPLTSIRQQETEAAVYQALQQLKPIERAVIVANEFEGIPYRELGEEWEMPVNTLISHKARGLEKLKHHLMHMKKEE
jgi:RNA polymerase sigma factor (sigma-70 family)